jgi:hypothetical protein
MPSSTAASTAAGAAAKTMTVVVPRPPIAAATHAFSTPVVRELPPVQRPGMFDATW